MRAQEFTEGSSFDDSTIIDNENGLGYVPWNDNVDHHGLRVMMKPSVFFSLATPLRRREATSTDYIKEHIENGGKIASPFLHLVIDYAWLHKDFSKPARVGSHEGRNRMYAVQELFGDVPIETHLFFAGEIRTRDATPRWIQEINSILIPERSSIPMHGPFFTPK
jgi:hypothetical protein